MIYLGIDLGIGGALAAISSDTLSLEVYDTPVIKIEKKAGKKVKVITEYDEQAILNLLFPYYGIAFATIEMPGMRPGQATQAAFKVGVGFGLWRGCLAASSIGYSVVAPVTWKKSMGLIGFDKNGSRLFAQKFYPKYAPLFHQVRDDGRAEAVLLATYGMRERGEK